MTVLLDVFLLGLLVVTAGAIVRVRNLFAVAMLSGIYSLLSAGLFTTMDAVDVAFTEASVGAGISTVLVLAALLLVGREEARPSHGGLLPLLVVLVTGAALVYGTLDLPPFGSPDNPIHHHVAPRYIAETPEAVGIPNVVTSVLASYRGYDTMGETTVVFTALVGVLVLLMGSERTRAGARSTEERTGQEGEPLPATVGASGEERGRDEDRDEDDE